MALTASTRWTDPLLMPPSSLLKGAGRLAALEDLSILDTAPASAFDDLVELAAIVLGRPIAAVNFVNDARLFSKAVAGLPAAIGTSTPNDQSFCAHTISAPGGRLTVCDTGESARWSLHPR